MTLFIASYLFKSLTPPTLASTTTTLRGTPTLVALQGVLHPFQLSRNEDQAWATPCFHEVLLCQWAHQLGCLKFYHRHGSEWAQLHKASPARLAPVAFPVASRRSLGGECQPGATFISSNSNALGHVKRKLATRAERELYLLLNFYFYFFAPFLSLLLLKP